MSDAPPDEQRTAIDNVGAAAGNVADAIARMTEVSAARIFNPPVHAGDRVIITAAAFDVAGGLGSGMGGDNEGNGGGGSGGGGSVNGRPVAAIVIGPDGVEVKPVLDLTRIGLTVVMTAFAIWRVSRRR